jgi:hypothetical protein
LFYGFYKYFVVFDCRDLDLHAGIDKRSVGIVGLAGDALEFDLSDRHEARKCHALIADRDLFDFGIGLDVDLLVLLQPLPCLSPEHDNKENNNDDRHHRGYDGARLGVNLDEGIDT